MNVLKSTVVAVALIIGTSSAFAANDAAAPQAAAASATATDTATTAKAKHAGKHRKHMGKKKHGAKPQA